VDALIEPSALRAAKASTVEYDIVKTDIGHSYNPQRGIFTAPVKGVHLFSNVTAYRG
jgi:hypothetical protein